MTGSEMPSDPLLPALQGKALLVDPRQGDAEDDISSPKKKSLFMLAGGMLAEISLTKLLLAWIMTIVIPGVLLGLAPLVASAWLISVADRVFALAGLWTLLTLLVVAAIGILGWRPLLREAETSFWSLNALAIKPGYVLCREALRHISEKAFDHRLTPQRRARLRAIAGAGAGIILAVLATVVALMAWPSTRWTGLLADLWDPFRLVMPALANAIVIVCSYLAVAALVWGIADATMDQPLDIETFDTAAPGAREWRVAHLSDIHIVGENYGFRIESGRAGPRGNDRLHRVLDRLDAIHAARPLDLVLISGDMTDAGISSEWAEFLDSVARHPQLAERMLILPGNHDVNIVDRANPARLDLPLSPGKRLRQVRTLSAMAALQGDRVRIIQHGSHDTSKTLNEALAPHREMIAQFADTGAFLLSAKLNRLWDDLFPMVALPETDDGLGVIILNSNADTHFSFTNALGMVSAEQAHGLSAVVKQFPRARWIVALHHHLMEYPMRAKAFSERVGTALVNGTWFVRQLKPLGRRAVVMHGHRHTDWIGHCGDVRIISAPSPVMGVQDQVPTHFHIVTLAAGANDCLDLLLPERIDIAGLERS